MVDRALTAVAVLLVVAVLAPSLAKWLVAAVPALASILVLLVAMKIVVRWLR